MCVWWFQIGLPPVLFTQLLVISFGWEGRAEILFRRCSASALWGSCLRSWFRLISASPELLANNTAPREKRLLTTEHLLRRNDLLIYWGVENQREAGAWYIGEICREGRSVHEIELRQSYSWGRTDAEVFMRWTWSGRMLRKEVRTVRIELRIFLKFQFLNLNNIWIVVQWQTECGTAVQIWMRGRRRI